MITASISYNGTVTITLKGENSEEKQILGLITGGRSVKEIKPGQDESIVLVLSKSEGQ